MSKPRLVIGDLHAPWVHPEYLAHCLRVHQEWGCGSEPILIGDEIDMHAISDHDTDPDQPGAGEEFDQAIRALQPWYDAFPAAKICIGNHSARWFRRAFKAGIPERLIKGYREVLEAPRRWTWQNRFVIENVLYTHGNTSGRMAVINRALREGISVAHGHTHCHAGVLYQMSRNRGLIFALNVGCGINEESRAFRYAADTPDRPTIGCGVVINAHEAHWIPMPQEQLLAAAA